MNALDWLSRQLGGDPEAEGAAQASTAMQPAVEDWYDHGGVAGMMGLQPWDVQAAQSQQKMQEMILQGRYGEAALAGMEHPALGLGVGNIGKAGPIRAYHGSPHDFNAFDSSKIGTGEGAQAYGHGLYFTDTPNIAEHYRANLSGAPGGSIPTDVRAALRSVDHFGFDSPGEALGAIRRHADWQDRWSGMPDGSDQSAYNLIQKYLDDTRLGKVYEVDLHADPATLLDWDKPLIAQNPQVQQALKGAGIANPQSEHLSGLARGGDDIYHRLVRQLAPTPLSRLNSPPLASQQLREAGIPGIKYLDAGSRNAGGEGTSNYVMFDDKLIEILRKYGLAGLTAGAGGAAALAGGAGEAQAGALDRLRQQLGEPPT